MSRSGLSTLVAACALGLSCAPTWPGIAPLPAVSAAPAPAPRATTPAAELVTEDVAKIAGHIRRQRRTSLVDGEVEAVARAIARACRHHGIDPSLVLAVIHVESRFDAYAVSSVGAMGLMQILPSTAEELAERIGEPWYGATTLFDPAANVRLGVAYLDQLAERYGDTSVALAAYNWGPGRIDQRLRLGTPMPTIYPGLVFKAYSRQDQRRS